MTIEYDGSPWHGWQIQRDRETVQSRIETALETVLRTRVRLTGSGRTDAGVHARGQVAHFDTAEPLDGRRLTGALNGLLPESIAVLGVEEASAGFHARYDARRRRYHYHVSTSERALDLAWRVLVRPAPDFARMNEAATTLLGTHGFDAFCRTSSPTQNRVCTVYRAEWRAEGRPDDWLFAIEADRFLHGMVRAIVGTLLEIGRGTRDVDDLGRVVASRDRREAGPAAPAAGLVLEAVEYGPVT